MFSPRANDTEKRVPEKLPHVFPQFSLLGRATARMEQNVTLTSGGNRVPTKGTSLKTMHAELTGLSLMFLCYLSLQELTTATSTSPAM